MSESVWLNQDDIDANIDMINKYKKEIELIFKPLEFDQMPKIVNERNKILETLRTPYMLTMEMQQDFFKNTLCNRNSATRYFGFYRQYPVNKFLWFGMGGIENIQWENSIGELSILIFEEFRGKGLGEKVVDKIIDYGFNYLNLNTLFGECYTCANIKFWQKIIDKYQLEYTYLPKRKYYRGQYWDSLYFTFDKNKFNNLKD